MRRRGSAGLRAWASPKSGMVGGLSRARNPPRARAPEADPGLEKGEEGTPKMDLKGRPACGVPAVLSPRPHRTGRFQPPRPPLFGDPLRGRAFQHDLRGAFSALRARPARSGRGADVFGSPVRRLTEPFGTALQSRRPPESDATERPPRDRLPSACMTRCARGSSPEGSGGRSPWLGIDVKDYFLEFFRAGNPRRLPPSWPGSARPSTPSHPHARLAGEDTNECAQRSALHRKLHRPAQAKSWMPGPSPGMTKRVVPVG